MTEPRARPPVRLLVLGRPGAGKGTQSDRLARVLGVPHIAIGDLLRAEVEREDPGAREIARFVDRGRLVPDHLVTAVLDARLAEPDAASAGFVLDGYPRSIEQANVLEHLLDPGTLTAAIELLASQREATHRLLTRFVCVDCGHSATRRLRTAADASTDACARCGGPLRRRADDDVSVMRERFDEFEHCTKPLLEWLDRRGLLVSVDAERAPDLVAASVLDALAPALTRIGMVGTRRIPELSA